MSTDERQHAIDIGAAAVRRLMTLPDGAYPSDREVAAAVLAAVHDRRSDVPEKPPTCRHCSRTVMACAPCCRHGGWVHKHDKGHLCDPLDPTGHLAFPTTGSLLSADATKPAWA